MENQRYFKGRYIIVFYDASDEEMLHMFDNIHDICKFRKLEYSPVTYNLIKIELYRALKRPDHRTTMLTGVKMHVYLVDILEEESEL